MADTAQQLITKAYRKAGAVSSGADPTADELSDGLDALNDMLYNLSEQGITVPWTLVDQFSLTPGQITYFIGPALPGAPAGETQPLSIEDAYLLDGSGLADPFNNTATTYPFEIISSAEYADIPKKASTGRPQRGWYTYGEPNGTLVIDRDPDETYTLVLISRKHINTFSALSAAALIPLSYNRMLIFNLAVELGSELGAPLDPRVIQIAKESLKTIKNANLSRTVRNLKSDDGLLSNGSYDISGDQY